MAFEDGLPGPDILRHKGALDPIGDLVDQISNPSLPTEEELNEKARILLESLGVREVDALSRDIITAAFTPDSNQDEFVRNTQDFASALKGGFNDIINAGKPGGRSRGGELLHKIGGAASDIGQSASDTFSNTVTPFIQENFTGVPAAEPTSGLGSKSSPFQAPKAPISMQDIENIVLRHGGPESDPAILQPAGNAIDIRAILEGAVKAGVTPSFTATADTKPRDFINAEGNRGNFSSASASLFPFETDKEKKIQENKALVQLSRDKAINAILEAILPGILTPGTLASFMSGNEQKREDSRGGIVELIRILKASLGA